MKETSQTNPDNKPQQITNRRSFQAQSPFERTDESGYQGLPLKYRPIAGLCQRDPLDYEVHPYPSMKQFAEFLDRYRMVECEPYTELGEIVSLEYHAERGHISIHFDGEEKPTGPFKPREVRIILENVSAMADA